LKSSNESLKQKLLASSINNVTKQLGRWLGVSHCVGSDLCYWIVTDSGQAVSKTSVEHVTCNDYLNEDMKANVKEFEKKLGNIVMILILFYREKIMLI
jgi:hypothetical protein